MEPVVVICAINQRLFASGRALPAVFNTYQDPPVKVVTFNPVPPPMKYPLMVGVKAGSSTMLGSAAPAVVDIEAGPSKLMVA